MALKLKILLSFENRRGQRIRFFSAIFLSTALLLPQMAFAVPTVVFTDDCEMGNNWGLFEEVVNPTCYADGIASLQSILTDGGTNSALQLGANDAGLFEKSNHAIANYEIVESGQTGLWRFSVDFYLDPLTLDESETGPEISVQSTRQVTQGTWRTHIAGIQYLGYTGAPNLWNIWTKVGTGSEPQSGTAAWVPLNGVGALTQTGWHRIHLTADLSANEYTSLKIDFPDGSTSIKMLNFSIAAEVKFSEAAFWLTVEAENRYGCGMGETHEFDMLYDNIELTLESGSMNHPPVAPFTQHSIPGNNMAVLDPGFSDVDGNIDLTTLTITLPPSNGSAIANADGTITYSPNPGFFGGDGLKYRICDTALTCAEEWLEISVTNSTPYQDPNPYQVSTSITQSVTIPLPAQDDEGNINLASLLIVSNPLLGSVSVNTNTGEFLFTPDSTQPGVYGFQYQVCDGLGWCAYPWIEVAVTNAAPIAPALQYTLSGNSSAVISVSAGDPDSNLDWSSLSVSLAPTNGVASAHPDKQSISYTPNTDFFGGDGIKYRICDVVGLCSEEWITISVVNTAPYQVAIPYTVSTGRTEPLLIPVPAQDDEGNLDLSSLSIETPPPLGEVVVDANAGGFLFTPDVVTAGTFGFQYKICDTLVWCTWAWIEVTVDGAAPVGTMPMNVNVSRDGTAQIELPIPVPPGVRGMAPSVSLQYDSGRTGSGHVGLGWSLSATSVIERCQAPGWSEKNVDPIDFDLNDRFCLDGQKLIAINGEYGLDGTEYRTEHDSFAKVVSYASVGTQSLGPVDFQAGPGLFTVWRPDGTIHDYGATPNAVQGSKSETFSEREDVLEWWLRRSRDLFGNIVEYSYEGATTHSTASDASNYERRLQSIKYTEDPGLRLQGLDHLALPSSEVRFIYEISTAPYRNERYINGAKLTSDRLLSRIEVLQDGAIVRVVHLTYETHDMFARLVSVQTCSSLDTMYSCLPPTTVDWTDDTESQEFVMPTAASMLPWKAQEFAHTAFGTQEGWDWGAYFQTVGDVDGDGLIDLVVFGHDEVLVALNNGNGFDQAQQWSTDFGFRERSWTCSGWWAFGNCEESVDGWQPDRHPRFLADVDGDGADDIVGFGDEGIYVGLSTKDPTTGFLDAQLRAPELGFDTAAGGYRSDKHPRFVMDLNNDGRADVGAFGPDGLVVSVGPSYGLTSVKQAEFGDAGGWVESKHMRTFADMNGDNLPDIVGFNDEGVMVSLAIPLGLADFDSDGNIGFGPAIQWSWQFGIDPPYQDNSSALWDRWTREKNPRFLADVNGDGLDDVVGFGVIGVYVGLSDGRQILPASEWTRPEFGNLRFGSDGCTGDGAPDDDDPLTSSGCWDSEYHFRQLADVNGDGMADIVAMNHDVTFVSLSNGAGFEQPTEWVHHFGRNSGLSMYVVERSAKVHRYIGGLQGRESIYVDYSAQGPRYLVDVDGDGMLDILGYADTGAEVALSKQRKGTVWKVTDGHGNSTKFSYSPLTDNTVYSVTTEGLLNTSHPKRLVHAGGIQVVSQMQQSDGVGGERTKQYKYADLKLELHQGKSLGMRTMDIIDLSTGITTEKIFDNSSTDVLSGRQLWSTVSTSEGTVIETTQTQYGKRTTHAPFGLNGGSISPAFITLNSVEIDRHDPETGAFISQTNINETFDPDFGTSLQKTTTVTGLVGNDYVTVEINDYDNFDNPPTDRDDSSPNIWRLGEPNSTTVTVSTPGNLDVTRVTNFDHDASGRLITQISDPTTPFERVHTFSGFNHLGLHTSEVESWSNIGEGLPATQRTTVLGYDPTGRFVDQRTNALGHTESWTYDSALGVQLTHTDSNGVTTRFAFDPFGRRLGSLSASSGGSSTQFLACDASCPTNSIYQSIHQSSGKAPTISYHDSLDRIVRTEQPLLGGQVSIVDILYDSLGRSKMVSQPYLPGEMVYWTDTTYDVLDRPTLVVNPNGSSRTVDYIGLETHTTDERGLLRVTHHNVLGEVVKIVETGRGETVYKYGSHGNLREVTDVAGNVLTRTYDLLGRMLSEDDPDRGLWTYQYNALDLPWWQQNPKGELIQTDYDLLGRATQVADSSGTTDLVYDTAQNGVGLLDSRAHGTTSETFFYDSLGRRRRTDTVIDGELFSTSNSYDAAGRVLRTVYPTGLAILHDYDPASGTLIGMRDAETLESYWSATAMNRDGTLNQYDLGTAVQLERSFAADSGNLESIRSTVGATPLLDLAYTYTPAEDLDDRQDLMQGLTESFVHDVYGQLINVSLNGVGTQQVTYDILGNIVTKTDVGTYTYDLGRPHAVASVDDGVGPVTSYGYDANGNMISGGGRTVTYNPKDLPEQITNASGDVVDFTYGAGGQVLKKSVQSGGVTRDTVLLGKTYERVSSSNGDLIHRHRLGGLAIVVEDGVTREVFYLLRDLAGSVVAVSDSQGQIVERLSYDAWGQRRGTDWQAAAVSGSENISEGYTGHLSIGIAGLVHMKARAYDPVLGRFLSADSIVPGMNPMAWNRYAYVSNNPLVFIDPSGHARVRDTGALGSGIIQGIFGLTMFAGSMGLGPLGYPGLVMGADMFVGGMVTVIRNERTFSPIQFGLSKTGLSDQNVQRVYGGLVILSSLTAVTGQFLRARAAASVRGPRAGEVKTVGGPNAPNAARNAANAAKLGKQLGSEAGVAELLSGGGRAIAGAGTKVPLRDVGRLVAEHGGKAADWAKITSTTQGGVQIHAYRNAVLDLVVEFKSIIP